MQKDLSNEVWFVNRTARGQLERNINDGKTLSTTAESASRTDDLAKHVPNHAAKRRPFCVVNNA